MQRTEKKIRGNHFLHFSSKGRGRNARWDERVSVRCRVQGLLCKEAKAVASRVSKRVFGWLKKGWLLGRWDIACNPVFRTNWRTAEQKIHTIFGNRNEWDLAVEPQIKENQKGNQSQRKIRGSQCPTLLQYWKYFFC